MALLITYSQAKIPQLYQKQLAQWTKVIYLPLIYLQPRTLTLNEIHCLQQATDIAITSNYGAYLFQTKYAHYNPTATLHVLSAKTKQKLQVPNAIQISDRENRAALVDQMHQINPATTCWLLSDRVSPSEAHLPGTPLVIYSNTWTRSLQKKALTMLSGQPIDWALVTSGSNFQRLLALQTRLDDQDWQHTVYYVLGHKTGSVIAAHHYPVVYPGQSTQVLEQILNKLVSQIKMEANHGLDKFTH